MGGSFQTACGYFDGNDANSLRCDPMFKLAVDRAPQFEGAALLRAPSLIVLDMDHSEDATHGQQELAFYNHHYGSYFYLPLFLFEGISGKLATAELSPGKRPNSKEKATIMKRVLRLNRYAFPGTPIVLRGDAHFANPELRVLRDTDPNLDFLLCCTATRCSRPRACPCWA